MISLSPSKSGSNWLDRLRTSRGFPTPAEPDLDRFLASSSSSAGSTQPGNPTRSESTHSIPRTASASLAGRVSEVLCDLFNMPGESFSRPHKTGRKQSNPKCFDGGSLTSVKKKHNNGNNNGNELCSSDDLRRDKSDNNAVVSSGDNSLNDKNATIRKKRSGSGNDNVAAGVGVEDEDDINLKAFTRSEVTVIDTSTKDWKSDKWLFRKKESGEWRVKDKKRGGKKRKYDGVDDENESDQMLINNNGGKEKEKVKVLHLNQLQSQNDNEGEPLKEPSHLVSKVPHSRFPCPRPPEKSRPDGSSVILLKPMPLSNNTNVITKLGKSIHKKKPKKMKLI